jgi:hypothetical protein
MFKMGRFLKLATFLAVVLGLYIHLSTDEFDPGEWEIIWFILKYQWLRSLCVVGLGSLCIWDQV